MRSGWISASTMTEKGLDIFRAVEVYNLDEEAARKEGLLEAEQKAWEERIRKKQALVEITFMLFISKLWTEMNGFIGLGCIANLSWVLILGIHTRQNFQRRLLLV